ncbi:hypothetical protein J6X90_00595 [Candidatus Saccharibacteria bacterium]|nr:hypothetical protein [Candidatus Saccharibacteria bacterium]
MMRRKGTNSVYLGSEKSLLDALSKILNENRSFYIRPIDITKEANLAKSSFYIHYSSVQNLIEVNEKKVLNAIERLIQSDRYKRLSSEGKWRNILYCLYQYREYLTVIIKSENIGFQRKLFTLLKDNTPTSRLNWCIKNEKLVNVTIYCLIAVLEMWQKEGFNIDKIAEYAQKLNQISASTPHFFWQFFP